MLPRGTHADELPFVVHLERRTTEDYLSRWITRLVLVFILEIHNQMNNKCLPKFVQMQYNASSSIKEAILSWHQQQMRIKTVLKSSYDVFIKKKYLKFHKWFFG